MENRDKKKQRTLRFDKSMLREALQSFVKMEREILDFKKELTVRYGFLFVHFKFQPVPEILMFDFVLNFTVLYRPL